MALIKLDQLGPQAQLLLTGDTVPIGTVIAYAGTTTNLPTGYLPCDGREVSRIVYAQLFAVIGTMYGDGDGVETFNLPNANDGRFLEGATTAGIAHEAGLPNITGEVGGASYATDYNSGAFKRTSTLRMNWAQGNAGWADGYSFDASRSSTIYGNSTTVQPNSLTVIFLIKAVGPTSTCVLPHITVNAPEGCTVIAAKGTHTLTLQEEFTGVYETDVPQLGTWTLTCTQGERHADGLVSVDNVANVITRMVPSIQLGFRIRKDDPDPAAMEYTHDAVGARPAHMNYDTGVFDYGDWADAWFVRNNRPCMLTNNGEVDYYLNSDNYSQRANGGDSDVANANYAGNAMSEFPLCWVKRWEDDKYWYEVVADAQVDDDFKAYAHTRANGTIADNVYVAMFNGSGSTSRIRSLAGKATLCNATPSQEIAGCTANGAGWYTITWSQRELRRTLLFLMGLSRDVQSVYGVGNLPGGTYPLTTGTLTTAGQFHGSNSASTQVKVFHCEAPWGDMWDRVAGFITNGTRVYVKMTREGQGYRISDTTGYKDTGITLPNVFGQFVTNVVCNEFGMIPVACNADAGATHFCSPIWVNTGFGYMFAGGAVGWHPQNGGTFSFFTHSGYGYTYTASNVGCRLSCEQPTTT